MKTALVFARGVLSTFLASWSPDPGSEKSQSLEQTRCSLFCRVLPCSPCRWRDLVLHLIPLESGLWHCYKFTSGVHVAKDRSSAGRQQHPSSEPSPRNEQQAPASEQRRRDGGAERSGAGKQMAACLLACLLACLPAREREGLRLL